MTVGPWKPITLQSYGNRIVDIDIRTDVSESLDVKLSAEITFAEKKPGFTTLTLKGQDSVLSAPTSSFGTESGHAKVVLDFKAGDLKLWYPVGYGEQALYTVTIELTDEAGKYH
jgi:beta-mannosidase